MTVEIRSSARVSAWYQVTELAIGTAALRERMQRIALADWLRLDGTRRVEVTATDRASGAVAVVYLDTFRFARE